MKYLGLDIDLNDTATWDYLCEARNLKGLFQLETRSAGIVLKKIKPRSVRDLSICNALNRPGASAFTKEVSEIKNEDKPITYDHPDLEPILNETYGKFIYQEQLMKCAQRMASFTAKESNALLKAMGKKDKELMKAQKDAFVNGMVKNKYNIELAELIFKKLEAFADYGFNASHSYSYSLLGLASAFIKIHHPVEFFTSLLNYSEYEQNSQNEIFDIVGETRHFGIDVVGPSVDRIVNKFEIVDGKIHYPIGKLRNVGESIFDKLKLLDVTQITSLDGFFEAATNAAINRRSMESIIISGALDKFGEREDILFYFWFISELSDKVLENFWHFKTGRPATKELIFQFLNFRELKAPKGKAKQLDLNFEGATQVVEKVQYKSYFRTEVTRLKVLELMTTKADQIDFYKRNKAMARFFWEHHVLGYTHNNALGNTKTFKHIQEEYGDFKSCGFVEEVQTRTSKKGNEFGIFTLKFDETLDLVCFGKTWDEIKGFVKENDFVSILILKDDKGSHIERIDNLTVEKRKYEFYKKHETGK